MKWITALFLMASLSNCVIVSDRDDSDASVNWRQIEAENRELIANLQIGTSAENVRSSLGPPQSSESYESQDGQTLILRYRTQLQHADGKTSKDETTPLVFVNDRLVGWGQIALRNL